MNIASLATDTFYFVLIFAPIAMLCFYTYRTWKEWKGMKQREFFLKKDYRVLEIRMPVEITRGPAAMEHFFVAFNEMMAGHWYAQLTDRKTRPIRSYEIASFGGKVKFFVRIEKGHIDWFSGQLYAHYPTIEIVEVPDYTKYRDFDPDKDNITAAEYDLNKADPIPIQTYKTFGLNETGTKEEQKIDPLSQVIETLATIGPHEQIWLQFVVRAHVGEDAKPTTLAKRWQNTVKNWNKIWYNRDITQIMAGDTEDKKWKEAGKKLIEDMKKDYTPEAEKQLAFGGQLTPRDKQFIEIVQTNLEKTAFQVGIRLIYIAAKEHHKGRGDEIGGLFKTYSSPLFNDFKPAFMTGYSIPWQDKDGSETLKQKKNAFKNYKRREFFFGGDDYKYNKSDCPTSVFSSEELATLYHLPGSVVQTPTMERLGSTTGQGPQGLPVDDLPIDEDQLSGDSGAVPSNLPVWK